MAQTDYYLKIEGIPGESEDSKHKNEIELLSWSWSESNSGSHSSGAGGGAGKVAMGDFSFMMLANKASPKLMLNCATGQHVPTAVLTARKAGGDQQEYLKITLSDVLISSYQTGGSQGDVIPADSVTLNFAKIEFEYKPQMRDGTMGSPVKVGYDLKANKKI